MTVLLTAIDEQTTAVDFTHVKFLNEQARKDHEGGWGVILDPLENMLSCESAAVVGA